MVGYGNYTLFIKKKSSECYAPIHCRDIIQFMKTNKVLYACLLSFALSSCAYIDPLIQDANVISIPDEVQASNQMAAEVAKSMTVSQSPQLTALGNRLVAALPQKDFEYQFFVVNNAEPNAFTIPGAKIYVHAGLLKFADDENELAGVVAHEIGHAYQRHPAKAMTRQLGLAQISTKLAGGNNAAFKQLALKIAGTGALNFYGRKDETEADAIGFELLRKAGYPSDGLTRFLQKLLKIQTGGQPPAFLSSHPPTPERIAALNALAAKSKA